MKIISHEKKKVDIDLFHIVIVESVDRPSLFNVAIEVGYHPHGYSEWDHEIKDIGPNLWQVTWYSYSKC